MNLKKRRGGDKMINEFVLTFDVDWAPDYMIEHTVRLLRSYNVKSTWFLTHESKAINNLLHNDLIEVGIHPNFLPGSTQGESTIEVMDNLVKAFPMAKVVRTHAMVYSSEIAKLFCAYHFERDSSIFLDGMPGIQPYTTHYTDEKSIVRLPYCWSDDGELRCRPKWLIPKNEGMKILDFHPVHIFLNTAKKQDYLDYKAIGTMNLGNRHLTGSEDYLKRIIVYQENFKFLSEL